MGHLMESSLSRDARGNLSLDGIPKCVTADFPLSVPSPLSLNESNFVKLLSKYHT